MSQTTLRQIHILEPGANRTSVGNIIQVPAHPAYTNPNLMTNIIRNFFLDAVIPGDPDKLARIIYRLFPGEGDDLPLRIPLGKDTVQHLRSRVEELTAGVDKVEKYSDNLVFD
jgi:hypothetical protein